MALKIIPASEVRSRLATVLNDVERDGEPCFITQHGRSKAVLMSMDRYQAMMDIMEDREDEEDSELAARIAEARRDYKAVKGVRYHDYLKSRE